MEGEGNVKPSRNRNSDFDIIVGEDVFNTHKDLLDKYSMYFHEKFERGYKHEQRVQLHTNAVGMEWCLEYMYTESCPPDKYRNVIDVTVLKEVLKTSKLLRIQAVQTKIQDLLLRQMKDSDGLTILKFLREYGTSSYIRKVRKFVKDNIHVAMNQEEFLEIDSDDFIYYILGSEASPESMWNGIDSWMRFNKEREGIFYKALDIMLSTKKDITPILVDVVKSDHVQNDRHCQERVLRELKSREETMIETLNTKSSIQLLTVLKYAFYRGELQNLKRASIQFLAENMKVSIVGYQDLELDNLVEVLDAASSMVTALQKWNVVKNWIQLESSREKHLQVLLIALLSKINITSIIFDLFQSSKVLKQKNCKECIIHHMKRYEEKMIGDLNANLSVELLCIFRSNDFPVEKFLKLQEAAIQVLVQNIKTTTIDYQALDYKDFYQVLKKASPIITNQDKWERIAPWVRHSKSREYHMLPLIKMMDSSSLTSRFISKYMKSEPCIKSSRECMNYLLDVQLDNAARSSNKPKKETQANLSSKIAIFNDGTPKLTIVDPGKKTQATIPIPQVRSGARIASLSGDLYILSGKDLFKLKQGGLWIRVLQDLKYSDSWVQFIASGDKLAIITKTTTIMWSPTSNGVIYNRGCELGNGFSSAGSHGSMFAVGGMFSSGTARGYTADNKWSNLPAMPIFATNSAAVCYRDKLYVMGGSWCGIASSSVICLDGIIWTKLNPLIRRRSGFSAVVYRDKILVLGGTSGLFKRTESVEQYCGGQWKEAGRTELLNGTISLAQCRINDSNFRFTSKNYGIDTLSTLRRRNTTRT